MLIKIENPPIIVLREEEEDAEELDFEDGRRMRRLIPVSPTSCRPPPHFAQ